jgi:hypothetical protein
VNPTDAIALLEEINAAAEADMLAGNPIQGAHHRAILRRLEALRQEPAAREFHSTVPLTDARPRPVGWWPRDEGENPL